MTDAMSMSDDLYLVNSGENREQRIGGVDSGANPVEVDAGMPGDDAGLSFESYRFDAVGEIELVRGQVGIDLLLAQNRRSLVGMRQAGVGFDVVELALHTGEFRRGGGSGCGASDERTSQQGNGEYESRFHDDVSQLFLRTLLASGNVRTTQSLRE